jgi:type II secretory ATPase GspE/PulE/Tfp pilus assembly ATPase PilB-like protein
MWRGEIYRSVGCAECDNTGYRGRMAIMEIFKMNQDIDELIALRSTGREIREAARKTGYRTLAEDAVARILAGLTDIDEVSRVVDLTDRVS